MLDALRKRVLTFVVRVGLLIHVLTDSLKTLLHLFVAFSLNFVKLGVFGVDYPAESFNDVFGLFLVCLCRSRLSDVIGEILEMAVFKRLEEGPVRSVWFPLECGRVDQHAIFRIGVVHSLINNYNSC